MQKIRPFFWLDGTAEAAMTTYASLFRDGEILDQTRLGDQRPGADASLLMGTVRLAGRELMFMVGEAPHAITPAVSLVVACQDADEVTRLWDALADGGEVLMPLDTYPFSEKYGWLTDRFGVSWQLMVTGEPQTITPCLLFVGDQFGRAEEAMRHYTSIFGDSRVGEISRSDTGAVAYATFTLAGQDFIAMESDLDHAFTFTEATSFFITCDSQEEVDAYWSMLVDGGKPHVCGWLKDRFGVSWQVVPGRLLELMGDPDPARAGRVTQAMLGMTKIDIAGLQAAYDGA
jgi:predicted 3-demethylubiquinone-9 3-methyltransferase (glyoxalase superfamily)